MEFLKLLSGDTEIVKHIDKEGDYVLSADDLVCEGFHRQPENIRFRHIFDFGKKGAFIKCEAPDEGEFYLALQVQDTFGTYDEEFVSPKDEDCGPFCENVIELLVNDKPLGSFRYGGDDRKYYFFVTDLPVTLKKGDTVCYRVAEGKRTLFTSIIFMSEKPEKKVNEILNLTTENGEVRFWTRLASRASIILGEELFCENQYLNNHRFTIPKKWWGVRFVIEVIDEEGNILRGRGTCRSKEKMEHEDLSLSIPLSCARCEEGATPITTILPFAKGECHQPEKLIICDEHKNGYLTGLKVTSRWQDGSVRTAAANALLPLDGRKYFAKNNAVITENAVSFYAEKNEKSVKLEIDGKTYYFSENSNSVLPDRELFAVLYDDKENKFTAQGGSFEITEADENHIVITRENRFKMGESEHFKCISNLHFYRGVKGYALEFAFENDLLEKEHTAISGLYLEGEAKGSCAETVQLNEETVSIGGKKQTLRYEGKFDLGEETLTVKDFWQNYPKSFEASDNKMKIGICPFITEPELYRDEDIKLESRLFFYLKTGKYEIHCGAKKYHTILFGEDSVKLLEIPFLSPDKELVEKSRAFGHITCGCPDFPKYDKYMSDSLEKYMAHREKYREYGMMNYGDSFGEREIHWTNMEYDFPYGMIIHFLRTGDERFYRLAQSAAEHYEGIDCSHRNIHFEENGYLFIHTVGHANNYYPFEKLPQSFAYIKSHIGHIFVHGLAEFYKVTGIERYKEAVLACANSIAKYYALRYDFLTEREPGWSMLALEAAYELTQDNYYINACRIIAERVYEKQDPITGCLKYFMYIAPQEGITGEVCYGGKSFMHGIVGSALKYLYYLTGDKKAKTCACRIAGWLARDMFDEEIDQFWYTEAFKRLNKRVNQPEANIEILDVVLFACIEEKNKKYLEIAKRAFDLMLESEYRRECDISKVYSMRLRFAPEIMHDYALARKLLESRNDE